jgi:hypothetical protein
MTEFEREVRAAVHHGGDLGRTWYATRLDRSWIPEVERAQPVFVASTSTEPSGRSSDGRHGPIAATRA